jgi:uncharacterized protein YjdB
MKRLLLLSALALAVSGMEACTENPDDIKRQTVPVTGVEIDLDADFIEVDEQVRLSHIVIPHDATDNDAAWSSDDEAVATVSEEGLVEGVSLGTTDIVVRVGEFTARCSITVMEEVIDVVSVSLDAPEKELARNEEFQLEAIVHPADATDPHVTWASEDPSIATVNADGLVIGLKGGVTVVSATTRDAGLVAQCVVTVNVPLDNIVVTPAAIGPDQEVAIIPGRTVAVRVAFEPEDALNRNFTFGVLAGGAGTISASRDEEDYNTVNVTGVGVGTTTLIVTADARRNGTSPIQVFCPVVVSPAVASITLDRTEASVNAGSTVALTPTVLPADALDKSVVWASENEDIATVDTQGVVTGVAPGTATITATAADGSGVTARCTVYVKGEDAVFGFVSFRSDQTWSIVTGAGTFVWSDYVVGSRCKTDTADYKPLEERGDCLKNGSFYDLFSYNAVLNNIDLFCTDGWQRPSHSAYEQTDMKLYQRSFGPMGPSDQTSGSANWVDQWGLEYGGFYDGAAIVREETVGSVTSAFSRMWKGWPAAGNTISYMSLYQQPGPKSQAVNGNQAINVNSDVDMSKAMALRCVKQL